MFGTGPYVPSPSPYWEYSRYTVPFAVDADGTVRALYNCQPHQWEYTVKYPHEETENTNCHGLTEWANGLGADGWELVSTMESGKWIFKRPKRGGG